MDRQGAKQKQSWGIGRSELCPAVRFEPRVLHFDATAMQTRSVVLFRSRFLGVLRVLAAEVRVLRFFVSSASLWVSRVRGLEWIA